MALKTSVFWSLIHAKKCHWWIPYFAYHKYSQLSSSLQISTKSWALPCPSSHPPSVTGLFLLISPLSTALLPPCPTNPTAAGEGGYSHGAETSRLRAHERAAWEKGLGREWVWGQNDVRLRSDPLGTNLPLPQVAAPTPGTLMDLATSHRLDIYWN